MTRWRREAMLMGCLLSAMGVLPSPAQCPPLRVARAIIAAQQRIVSPRGIQQNLLLPVDGTKQWISIAGRDRRNPILLVLHGGCCDIRRSPDCDSRRARRDRSLIGSERPGETALL